MGRLVTNPPKPVVRVNVAQTAFTKILFLAQTVHDLTLANVADFATPIPTSANFQTDITALKTALKTLGTKSNKGGHAALNAVKAAANVVFQDLTARAFYVQEIVDGASDPTTQAVLISKSGFAAKNKKSITPVNQFPKGIRQSNSKAFPQTLRRIKWRKPLGNYSGFKPKTYNLYACATDGSNKVFLFNATKTNALIPATHPKTAAAIVAVMIHPLTATGEGNGQIINVA